MAKFEVTYADGTVKIETQSDCHTLEQFINCRFGSGGLPEKIVHLDEVTEDAGEEGESQEKLEEAKVEDNPVEDKQAVEKPVAKPVEPKKTK